MSDSINETGEKPSKHDHEAEAASRLLSCATNTIADPELPHEYVQNTVWEKGKSEEDWLAMKVYDLQAATVSYWAQPGDNYQYQITTAKGNPNAAEQIFRQGDILKEQPTVEVKQDTAKYREIDDLVHNQVNWSQCPPPQWH